MTSKNENASPKKGGKISPSLPAQNSERRKFYKSLFSIVAPIMAQDLLTAAVGIADVVMLGFVSQTAISAASLANYVQFVFVIFGTGLSSGVVMLSSQYWGKGDAHSIETIFGIAAKLSVAVGAAFAILSAFFPKFLMRIFTNDFELIKEGEKYLQIVSVSYLCLSVSQIFQATLKSVERVKVVTAITVAALLLNIFGNAIFIFGLFGFPKMGIRGVAFATTFSRMIQVFLCVIFSSKISELKLNIKCLFRKNKILLQDFFRYSLPAIGNEVVWGAGWAAYAVIMGHLGSDLVASNSIVNAFRQIATIACFGMAYGGAILLGKEIGSCDYELAKRNASRLVKSTAFAGFLGALALALCRPLLLSVADLTPEAREMLPPLLYINCLSVFGAAINTVLIAGVFRAGGDAKFGFVLDAVMMWCVSVPLGALCAFVFKMPPVAVYLILYADEWIKMAIPVARYKSRKWLKNITREFDGEG